MSDATSRHFLPFILPSQAQKHVTHNEALRKLDVLVQPAVGGIASSPPAEPAEGDCLLVGPGATGGWEGRENNLAAFADGAWMFHAPLEGWTVWNGAEQAVLVFTQGEWRALAPETVSLLGINTTADQTNRLAVAAPATLLSHEGGGHQLKINKAAAADTASLLMQSSWSGRAELGLAGDDDFHIKVSADGAVWKEALVVDAATGAVSLPNTTPSASSAAGDAGQVQFKGNTGFAASAGLTFSPQTAVLSTGSLALAQTANADTGTIRSGGNVVCHFTGGAIFIGNGAGNFTTTASSNVGIGETALATVTTGSNNLAIGTNALRYTTTGANNVAVGQTASRFGQTASNNVAIGNGALRGVFGATSGAGNVAAGFNAMIAATTAGNNVVVGSQAGQALTSGSGNVAIGNLAANGLVTGSNNTIVGRGATVPADLSDTVVLNAGTAERLRIDASAAAFPVPVRLPQYVVSGLPSPVTAGAGAMVFVSNEAGGATPAFSDGASWRRVTDRAVVS